MDIEILNDWVIADSVGILFEAANEHDYVTMYLARRNHINDEPTCGRSHSDLPFGLEEADCRRKCHSSLEHKVS